MRQILMPIAAACLAAGCQSGPSGVETVTLDDRPLVAADGQRRSLAFDSPYQRTLAAQDPYEVWDWWADRHDTRAATYSGYELPTYLYAHTRSFDRISDFGGEPRPTGTHTTHRGRILRGVR